jgi:hypothetical protein
MEWTWYIRRPEKIPIEQQHRRFLRPAARAALSDRLQVVQQTNLPARAEVGRGGRCESSVAA